MSDEVEWLKLLALACTALENVSRPVQNYLLLLLHPLYPFTHPPLHLPST